MKLQHSVYLPLADKTEQVMLETNELTGRWLMADLLAELEKLGYHNPSFDLHQVVCSDPNNPIATNRLDLLIEEGKVKEVTEGEDYTYITLSDCSFAVKRSHGITVNAGDSIIYYTYNFSQIRGVAVNGKLEWFQTDAQIDQDRLNWLAEMEAEKEAEWKKNKKHMWKIYSRLPKVFQHRIDRFRSEGPNFDRNYGYMECMILEQAYLIYKGVSKKSIRGFKDLAYAEAKNLVPKLDDGHSGNSIGHACYMAYFLSCYRNTKSRNRRIAVGRVIRKASGVMAPLVGTDAYKE